MRSFLLNTARRGAQRLDAPKTGDSLFVGRRAFQDAAPETLLSAARRSEQLGDTVWSESDHADRPPSREAETNPDASEPGDAGAALPQTSSVVPPTPDSRSRDGYVPDAQANASPPDVIPRLDPPSVEPVRSPHAVSVANEGAANGPDALSDKSGRAHLPFSQTRVEGAPAAPADSQIEAQIAVQQPELKPKTEAELTEQTNRVDDVVIRIPSTLYGSDRAASRRAFTPRARYPEPATTIVPEAVELDADAPGSSRPNTGAERVNVDSTEPKPALRDASSERTPREPTGEHQGPERSPQPLSQPVSSYSHKGWPKLEVDTSSASQPPATTEAAETNPAETPALAAPATVTPSRGPLENSFGRREERVPHSGPAAAAPVESAPKLRINNLEVRIINDHPKELAAGKRPPSAGGSADVVSALERNYLRSIELMF